jgi:hypothetical protein
MSTAFHLQTDGQTERINQKIETFLPSFVNLQRTDWVELLCLAELAYNNSTTRAHKMMRFYDNYGYYPSSVTTPTETNILSASSVASGHWMRQL